MILKQPLWRLGAVLVPTALFFGGTAARADQTPTQAPLTQTQQLSIFDRMSVEILGTGPDVILLPGFACSREVWRPLAVRLAANHRVHLVQYAGFAGEPWQPMEGDYIQPLADELERYIRDGGLRKPALIGHSMGGMLAIMLAQQHPEAVGRILSVDSLPLFPLWLGKTMDEQTIRRQAEQLAEDTLVLDDVRFYNSQVAAAAGLTRDPAMRKTLVTWALSTDRYAFALALRDLMELDLRPGLAAMTTPVWLAYAADATSGNAPDRATATWKREYASLPGAKFVLVDNSRHFIMVDQREKLDAVVDEFLGF